jgi:hypothetical protein
MSDPRNDSTSTSDGVSLSSTFPDFCAVVRNSDPCILPEPGHHFKIHAYLSEREYIELADALLENNNVAYLELETTNYTKSSAEVMAKYLRTSKRLQHIRLDGEYWMLRHRQEICFLPAFQESTSLKELHMKLPRGGGPSNLALEIC